MYLRPKTVFYTSFPYRKYYDAVYILFHIGMRISEFCGLTISDIDFASDTVKIEKQLLRDTNSVMYIEKSKTISGKRVIPMSTEVRESFGRIIENRPKYRTEPMIDGCAGFLYLDDTGKPCMTMNTYTHLGLDDAILELARLREQERVFAEVREEEERGTILKFTE